MVEKIPNHCTESWEAQPVSRNPRYSSYSRRSGHSSYFRDSCAHFESRTFEFKISLEERRGTGRGRFRDSTHIRISFCDRVKPLVTESSTGKESPRATRRGWKKKKRNEERGRIEGGRGGKNGTFPRECSTQRGSRKFPLCRDACKRYLVFPLAGSWKNIGGNLSGASRFGDCRLLGSYSL